MTTKSYNELIKLDSFNERFKYLKLDGVVGDQTFGSKRYLNQILYTLSEWRTFRRKIIIRDEGCDLGCKGFELQGMERIIVHHINPITIIDIVNRDPKVFDPNNVICTSHKTHLAIHYGDESLILKDSIQERFKNDTCPWK